MHYLSSNSSSSPSPLGWASIPARWRRGIADCLAAGPFESTATRVWLRLSLQDDTKLFSPRVAEREPVLVHKGAWRGLSGSIGNRHRSAGQAPDRQSACHPQACCGEGEAAALPCLHHAECPLLYCGMCRTWATTHHDQTWSSPPAGHNIAFAGLHGYCSFVLLVGTGVLQLSACESFTHSSSVSAGRASDRHLCGQAL